MLNKALILEKVIGHSAKEGFDESERVKLELIVNFAIAGTILVAIDQVFNFLSNNYLIKHLGAIAFYMLFGISTLLIYLKKYQWGKLFFCFFGLLLIAKDHYAYGHHFAVESLYLTIVALSAYLFDYKTSFTLLLVALTLYVYLFILDINAISPPYLYYIQPYYEIRYLMFVFASITVVTLFRATTRENELYQTLKEKQNEKLKLHNEQVKKFNYTLINHIHTPNKNITTFSRALHKDEILDESDRNKYIQFIHNNSIRLKDTIKELQALQNFQEVDQTNFTIESLNINDVLEKVAQDLRKITDHLSINITSEYVDNITSSHYPLFLVLKNLIRHIISIHGNDNAIIHFSFKRENDILLIYVDSIVKDKFIVRPNVAQQEFVPFNHNNSLEISIATRMLYHLKGNLYKSTSHQNTTFLVKTPVNIIKSKV